MSETQKLTAPALYDCFAVKEILDCPGKSWKTPGDVMGGNPARACEASGAGLGGSGSSGKWLLAGSRLTSHVLECPGGPCRASRRRLESVLGSLGTTWDRLGHSWNRLGTVKRCPGVLGTPGGAFGTWGGSGASVGDLRDRPGLGLAHLETDLGS